MTKAIVEQSFTLNAETYSAVFAGYMDDSVAAIWAGDINGTTNESGTETLYLIGGYKFVQYSGFNAVNSISFENVAGENSKFPEVGDTIPLLSISIDGEAVDMSGFTVAGVTGSRATFTHTTHPPFVAGTAYEVVVTYYDNVKASVSRNG